MEIQKVYKSSNPLLLKEENVLRYVKGGYHPVSLGDTFKNGRYKIKHKLGHGGFSTVWVARDKALEKWVSLKIIVAAESQPCRELAVLQALARRSETHSRSHNIAQLLDNFCHVGPNGCHQCLVFDLFGPTVDIIVNDYHEEGDRPDLDLTLSMSIQLLEAKEFLQEFGYVHGDLSPRNLCCASSCLSELPEDQLLDVLGPTECEELFRMDGKPVGEGVPKFLIQCTQWPGWPHEDEEGDDKIWVIDLGQAFPTDDVPARLPQPAGLQAPETIFTGPVDSNIDLWRIGLIIYYLTLGALPFQFFTTIDLVNSMISFLGDLPLEWRSKWDQMKLSLGHDLSATSTGELFKPRLEQLIADDNLDGETTELLALVRDLLKFRPRDRIPVSDALSRVRDIYRRIEPASRG